MKNILFATTALVMSGCVGNNALTNAMFPGISYQADMELGQQKMKIRQLAMNTSDLDTWRDQRQKIAMAIGDRVYDKDFSRVFDSLVVGISSLELKVANMERTSGYISATGISLPPSEAAAMEKERVREICQANGIDYSILNRPFSNPQMARSYDQMDYSGMAGKYDKMVKGLTFQLVKMSDTQTKVKLRFSDVFYPAELEVHYKNIWQVIDKQIFIDQNIEGDAKVRQ